MTVELLDAEVLVYSFLRRDVDDSEIRIRAEVDIDTWEELPYATFTAFSAPADNGLFTVTLSLNVFGDGSVEAFDACRDLHRAIHSWDVPGVAVDSELGAIESVEDLLLFSRTAAVQVNGKNVHQYSGSYSLLVRAPLET